MTKLFNIFFATMPVKRLIGCSKTRRTSTFSWFDSYLILFLAFGINIRNTGTNRHYGFLAFVSRNLLKIVWFVESLMMLSQAFYLIKHRQDPKKDITVFFIFFCSFFAWCHFVRYSRKIMKAVEKLQRVERLMKISPPRSLIPLLYFSLILFFILSMVFNYEDFDEKKISETFNIVTFEAFSSHNIDWSTKALIAHYHFLVLFYVVFYFTWYFTGFYVIICRHVLKIILKHISVNRSLLMSRKVTSTNCDKCFRNYNSLISTFNLLKSVLSLPAFWISSYNAATMLFGILTVMKEPNEMSLRILFFSLVGFLSFTFMTFTASAVNDADLEAKKINLKILANVENNKEQLQLKDIAILSQMCQSPAFSFSGWGFFTFTRGFYFTSIGCIITYSLLITNM